MTDEVQGRKRLSDRRVYTINLEQGWPTQSYESRSPDLGETILGGELMKNVDNLADKRLPAH